MDGYVLFGMGVICGVLLSYFVSDLVFEPNKEFENECDSNDY